MARRRASAQWKGFFRPERKDSFDPVSKGKGKGKGKGPAQETGDKGKAKGWREGKSAGRADEAGKGRKGKGGAVRRERSVGKNGKTPPAAAPPVDAGGDDGRCCRKRGAGAEACTLTFKPGLFGLNANWSTRVVTEVYPHAQAKKLGVQVGWKILKIDGQPFKEYLLDSKIMGGSSYDVTFDASEKLGQDKKGKKASIVAPAVDAGGDDGRRGRKRYTEAEARTFTFKPGLLGFDANWLTRVVTEVYPHDQARKFGVQVGWKILRIDGQPFTEYLLDSRIMGRSSYDVTFETNQELGQDLTRPNGTDSQSKKKRSPRSSGMDLSDELPTGKKSKTRRNDEELEKDDDDEDKDDVSDECSESVLQKRHTRACLRALLIQKRLK